MSTRRIANIAIIGGGPAGIAAAKYLVAEQAFRKIDIFEQRARVGGVWDYHNEEKPTSGNNAVSAPQLSPHAGLPKPIWTCRDNVRQAVGDIAVEYEDDLRFLSPLYDRLETNIPRSLMGFSDLEWPADAQLFPKHETVTEYLERHAEEVRHLIHFRTQVVSVKLVLHEDGQEQWLVETQKLTPNKSVGSEKHIYDAVVVASGHFVVPFIPDVKGMNDWSEKYPGSIVHSMHFKKPEEYEDKKVLVIGNGPSGIDIAAQIMTTCKKPLIQSTRSESYLVGDSSSGKLDKPAVEEYLVEDRAVRFQDGSIEKDIDVILYATGYFYSFPFLDDLKPPLVGDGTHVKGMYQHMIYRDHPTMAFPVLQQRVIPFPMSEAQAAVIARLWSGRLSLPSCAEMKAWEDDVYTETGGGRAFHLLNFPKDARYINAMYDWAMSAPEAKTKGKMPPRWGEKECWTRERFAAIKKAFQDKGEDRHSVRSMEELGFSFEAWQQEQLLENKRLL